MSETMERIVLVASLLGIAVMGLTAIVMPALAFLSS